MGGLYPGQEENLYFPSSPGGTGRSDRQTKLFLTLVGVGGEVPWLVRTPSNSWATPSLQADPGAQGATQNGQMTLAMQTSLFPRCLWPSSNFVPPSTNNRFALPVFQMENSGRREGKRLAYCPASVTPGGLQTLSLTGGPTRNSLSLVSAASPLPPLQRDSRGGGQGASSERWQSGHNPLPGWASCTSPPPASSSLHFPVSEQTRLRSRSLSFLACGRGQNGCGARAQSGLGCWVPPPP